MGADRLGPGTQERVRALIPVTGKPPADRLYGRVRGHTLRPRQQALLDKALPRIRIAPDRLADPGSLFDRPPARLALEIGYGGGEHTAALAASDPALGVIACEVFEPGICSLLSRLVPDTQDPAAAALPGNLRLWDDDARILMRDLPDACLDLAILMFPDPWPKARHAKRRFVHPAQVPLVARLVRPGGTWRVASDDPTYQDWVAAVMAEQPWFTPAEPSLDRPATWPPTRYEAKALRAGRVPRYWCFERTGHPSAGAGMGVGGMGFGGMGVAAAEIGWTRTSPPTA